MADHYLGCKSVGCEATQCAVEQARKAYVDRITSLEGCTKTLCEECNSLRERLKRALQTLRDSRVLVEKFRDRHEADLDYLSDHQLFVIIQLIAGGE